MYTPHLLFAFSDLGLVLGLGPGLGLGKTRMRVYASYLTDQRRPQRVRFRVRVQVRG